MIKKRTLLRGILMCGMYLYVGQSFLIPRVHVCYSYVDIPKKSIIPHLRIKLCRKHFLYNDL